MERRIRRLGIALVLLFAVVFAQLAYVQVFAADDIKSNPANFSRQLIAEYNVQRGKILTADGLVLAESVPAPKGSRYRYERRYPQGDLYGIHHRLLLEDLRPVRARAVDEHLPLR